MDGLKLQVNSEFGRLRKVIVHGASNLVGPQYLEKIPYELSYVDKEIKYHPESGWWDVEEAQNQLKTFQSVLKENGVELVRPENVEHAWLQLFTRDIGFVIGDMFYFANMKHEVRKIEQRGIEYLKELFPKYQILNNNGSIEGGDIFVHENKVFVGISRQTSISAFEELLNHVSKQGYKCIPVPCEESVLHLDCRFNIISPDKALIYGNDIKPEGIINLRENFNGEIIRGPDQEINTLGPNFLIISPNIVVVDKRNQLTIDELKNQGYGVIPLDFSEVTKMWGSFRCTTLPLYRE